MKYLSFRFCDLFDAVKKLKMRWCHCRDDCHMRSHKLSEWCYFASVVHPDLKHICRVLEVGIDGFGVFRALVHDVGAEPTKIGADGPAAVERQVHPDLPGVLFRVLVRGRYEARVRLRGAVSFDFEIGVGVAAVLG